MSSSSSTTPTSSSANSSTMDSTSKPRVWGSFEYDQDGKKHIVQFTKEGGDGESGVGGYVFGRSKECDFPLPTSSLISGRHFLVYKEVVHNAATGTPIEGVFLKDFSSNGTFVNGNKVGLNRRVQLHHHDKIQYMHETRKAADGRKFIFKEGEPVSGLTFESQYELGPQLGSGNFATVFKAICKKTGKVYAVKVVKKTENFSQKVSSSLEREIGILMGIDDPNLLRIRIVFNEPKFYYVVTELANDGELFDQIIDKQKFTEKEARHIFKQVLSGVKYLHDRGIVHRDLKPENILVMDKDELTVKISDFGLAKMVGEKVFHNTICGTPSYVAPEVINNNQYGKSVDMWSLGVVLYICLCGFPPFSDDLAPPRLRIQVLQSMYTFPSPYWDDVSDEAVDLVQGLLQQDTKERLTVDAALDHDWMRLEDDGGTRPSQARTESMPRVRSLLSRVMTERAERAIQRGVRVGYSQPTAFSQSIPDLPESDEDDEKAPSRINRQSQEASQRAEMDERTSSGIGIFSQDGMVRGTGMDTDDEDENENGKADESSHYYSDQEGEGFLDGQSESGTNDAVAGDDSDRSYMSVQDTFSKGSTRSSASRETLRTPEGQQHDMLMKSPSVDMGSVVQSTDDQVMATTILATPTTRLSRPDTRAVDEERSSKRARTEPADRTEA